jgi:transcriptional regulator of acetoin/glycerol metabolism
VTGNTTTKDQAWTTASIEAVPRFDAGADPTPGLVLVYSRLHEQLPAAVAFSTSPTTIGREADNTLSVPEAAVSRYHARAEQREDGFWIVDNGSTNGTLVNGERVTEIGLEEHDVVRIGDTIFRFASGGIYGYSAYRIDGTIVEPARPFKHGIKSSSLRGGYQVDAIIDRIAKVAPTLLSVVVTGESGTGKELVARELHQQSGRRGPFSAINCAALPANLIESELFGYRKGAFTGAVDNKTGLVRAANEGTLFLDEIGDMPLEAQAKLLRVLQEKEVLPLGATVAEPVDVRVVCATHRDLDAHVAQGRFRGDLLARLREVRIDVPPLRHRLEDLYSLTRHFLARAGRADARVAFSYVLGLAHYGWPYNVRELESAVKLSVALCPGTELDVTHLPDTIRHALEGHGRARRGEEPATAPLRPGHGSGTPSEDDLRALLSRHKGNIAAVGRELGKERMQVHRWLKRYAIDVNDYRG